MSSTAIDPLEEAIRTAGEGRLLESFDTPAEALSHIRRGVASAHQKARERLGDNAPDLREDAILEEYRRHPSQVRGFFQILGGTRTPDMLVMAWRIIQGMTVKEVRLAYRRKRDFQLSVILESPDGQEDPPYESDKITDFALFRHIGIMEVDGRPVFDGFYPLRVRGK